MKLSQPCPACGGEFSFRETFWTATPWNMCCRHCRTPVRFAINDWLLAGILVAVIAAIFILVVFVLPEMDLMIEIAAVTGLAIAAEMILVPLLFRFAGIEAKSKR